ncbi:MAG: Protein of unknown function (DUF559)/Domain of unknown function [Acidimicrobiales bacterium]|nr:Protein of unknown function (DUF559)/Domain of unknown function [Acidimicrobiales bacterium]
MLAVLDCGPSTYLSHGSAAALWDLPGFALEPHHVIIERGGRETPSDRAAVHRPRHLPEPFGTLLHGIPVVRPALLVLQLCATVNRQRAERALDTAWAKRLLSGPSLRRELDPLLHRGRAGTALLRELLDDRGPGYVPPASGLEARFESILAQAGEPPLRRQVDVGDGEHWCGRVDYVDPQQPLIVEIDSERYHAALVDARADADRTARLEAAGYVVERVTDRQVWHRPSDVVAAVRRARADARHLSRVAA